MDIDATVAILDAVIQAREPAHSDHWYGQYRRKRKPSSSSAATMPDMGVLSDMTQPYTAVESWLYDRFIAPGVTRFSHGMDSYLPPGLAGEAEILDVGCGGGHNAIELAERYPQAHITGLDLSPDQIARAHVRTQTRTARFSWIVGSAEDLVFSDQTFDLVYSIASIKHWSDPARGVAEMTRVAKPGAHVVIVEADRACRYEDVVAFTRVLRVPGPLRPIAVAGFRTWVAGRSLTIDEARALFADLPVRAPRVEPIPGAPAFIMHAIAE